jgi:hypothetical protein
MNSMCVKRRHIDRNTINKYGTVTIQYHFKLIDTCCFSSISTGKLPRTFFSYISFLNFFSHF